MFLFLSSDLAVIQEQSSSTVATSLDCEVRSNNTTTTPLSIPRTTDCTLNTVRTLSLGMSDG